ncbi:hypothetical protein H4V98_001213 [Polaromonas sp. CG_23.6]|nr:hypothetical protein [Polaromonas sp. CG_23.6]
MGQKRVGWYEKKSGVVGAVGLQDAKHVLCFMPDVTA